MKSVYCLLAKVFELQWFPKTAVAGPTDRQNCDNDHDGYLCCLPRLPLQLITTTAAVTGASYYHRYWHHHLDDETKTTARSARRRTTRAATGPRYCRCYYCRRFCCRCGEYFCRLHDCCYGLLGFLGHHKQQSWLPRCSKSSSILSCHESSRNSRLQVALAPLNVSDVQRCRAPASASWLRCLHVSMMIDRPLP